MTQKPKTEEEQVAFFESVHERFRQAVERVGEVHHDYRIAGTVVRLAFAGERLVPYFTRALEHLRIESHETPDATFCVWDSASTHVPMLPPPCDREAFSDRGDLWGFNSRRIKTAFHYHDFSVNLFEHERRTGICWVTEAAVLPYWVLASPLRTLFHWWMERNGCQLVHAAAVGIGDRALLAVGKGGLGKSSTALACLEAGFQFMGDDYVIVRNDPKPTVYGLYARHDGGWLSVATLIRLLADLGIDEPAVRSAISRLKRRGILQSRRSGGAAGYQLSAEALAILREGDARIFRRGRATPADGWVLAVFSVPESERHRRHVLRSELTRLGFGMVAPGVWIVPAHPQDTTAETLRRLELDAYADLFRADHLAFGA